MTSEAEKVVITKNIYVDAEDKMHDVTLVWHYFLRSEDKKLDKCKEPMCQVIIKAVCGSTTGLVSHLRSKHNIDIRKMKKDLNPTEGTILAVVRGS